MQADERTKLAIAAEGACPCFSTSFCDLGLVSGVSNFTPFSFQSSTVLAWRHLRVAPLFETRLECGLNPKQWRDMTLY
jgi:hypothetical protein